MLEGDFVPAYQGLPLQMTFTSNCGSRTHELCLPDRDTHAFERHRYDALQHHWELRSGHVSADHYHHGPSNAPWIAYSSDFSIRLTPDQGKLLAGQTQIITISGGTSNTGFQIGLFQGGSQTVTVTCG
jgi:hypothetical protein